MIHIENLYKYFFIKGAKHTVFENLNVVFEQNIKYGVLAKNGDGKTTLINMIATVDMPNMGKIYRKCNISWPIGSVNIESMLTAKQNVEFVCDLHGLHKAKKKEVIDYVENFAQIGKYFNQPINSYSSGMRARINFGISLAFADYFDFFLMDEATATGDIFFVNRAKHELLRKLQGKGCLLVSHNMSEIKQICEKFGVIVAKNIEFYNDFEAANKRYIEINQTQT